MKLNVFQKGQWLRGLVAGSLVALSTAALAQSEWPTRAVHISVGSSPGGVPDVVARTLAKHLNELTGKDFVVENRPGAGGNVAARTVTQGRPDGHSLLVTGVNYAVNQTLLPNPGYDYDKDLLPVAGLVWHNLLFMGSPTLPVDSIQELVAHTKKNPHDASMVVTILGSPNHLSALMLASRADLQPIYVPYAGIMPAIPDLVSGRVKVAVSSVTAALPLLQAERLKPLAVTGPTRSKLLPNVPTVAESGFPGFDVSSWIALMAPAGTPPELVQTIHAAVGKVLTSQAFQEDVARLDMESWQKTPDELREHIKTEAERWRGFLEQAGVKPAA